MKKWLGVVVLCCSMSAMANEMHEVCTDSAEFGGEVFELRQLGVGRDTALSLVKDALKDVRGEERIVAGQLLNAVVNGVYDIDLDADELAALNESEVAMLKQVFVETMRDECQSKMND
ncbi:MULTISPECIES: hypothetical protein [Vitreoscilla]|uniref:Uncharacterized protein n=1 Tax=Vitreoscilla stercoraria TaxID=61 RepID=A0ABY4EB22_VITST|nr:MULTISPECIES: hypothetical protein [Vitreoscilla]AUZ05637.1 hypothetical protein ADP71_22490 [Vitreoscilla sp. C1]UOO92950.1 hypothetical protein LVJ81_02605 [Vitreoscilla stercoraria]